MKLPGDIHELILEDLASKLDVLGQEKLEAWLEENGENKEICRKFCSLWYSGKWANSRVGIKKQIAWEQFKGGEEIDEGYVGLLEVLLLQLL